MIKQIVKGMCLNAVCSIRNNVNVIASFLSFICPFIAILIVKLLNTWLGILIACMGIVVVQIAICILREYAIRVGKGSKIPVPSKRFTEEDEDGEVTIPYNRLEEVILYLNDLENWLCKHGLF